MDIPLSSLKGYAVVTEHEKSGTVVDVLFDDVAWKVWWVVVETGSWLAQRRVVVHPGAIEQIDHAYKAIVVGLTRAQMEASPHVPPDAAVSRETSGFFHDHYKSNRHWGNCCSGENWPPAPLVSSPLVGGTYVRDATAGRPWTTGGDPNLRSITSVTGRHVHATDGAIGHITDLLVDDGHWDVSYLIVSTRNWWPGQRVLVSPDQVLSAQGADRDIHLKIGRQQVKDSPSWEPNLATDREDEVRCQGQSGEPRAEP